MTSSSLVQAAPAKIPLPAPPSLQRSARNQKILAIAIATLALFVIQLQISLSIALAATFLFTALTYLSEKYLRAGENKWFQLNFPQKKEVAFWATLLILKPLIIQIVFWALGIPIPPMPQEGLVKLILSRPWRMIPTAIFVAPFAEEVLFRGFLLERLEDLAHLWSCHICTLSRKAQQEISNIAQAVLFGAGHLNRKIQQGMQIPILLALSLYGYVFGLLKQQNRHTLLPPMVIHSANNAGVIMHVFASQR